MTSEGTQDANDSSLVTLAQWFLNPAIASGALHSCGYLAPPPQWDLSSGAFTKSPSASDSSVWHRQEPSMSRSYCHKERVRHAPFTSALCPLT